ncbi:hypothetical protein BRADI_1g48453v3 [Brachypodium distachyon]|uniref:Uncharacterized protein n=1 Tax=Brachypodium distachyon TaxID=15368 RepID=A0A0Q3L8K9_BRADI|nr:hypothetical protein BRADI_1g48453v3 [Brachypodium distachyon]
MCLQDWFRGSSADRDKLITQTVEAFISFDNEAGQEEAAPQEPSKVKHTKLSARNEEVAPQEPSKVKHSNPNKARHSKVLS